MLTQAKLQHFAPGDGVKHGAHKPDFVAKDWYDIAVPGDVHQTLIDAGVIEDPFYDRNEEKCAWMEGQEWWYRLALPAPAAPPPAETRLELIFHGLDTFATIWLNGEVLGSHSSMFYPARFDVTHLLQYDAVNSIAICFHPPLEMVKGKELDEAWGRNLERIFMRKAQFGYGWDWGPRLPTIGLWRPVELRRITGAAIQGIHFATVEIRPDDDLALVSVTVEATRVAVGGDLAAAVTLRSPDGDVAAAATVPLQPASGEDQQVDAGGMVYLQVANPSLWWTHDLGEPALYELEVQLLHDGAEVDDRLRRVGIRTIELDQSVDTAEPGTRFFRFLLNGVSIFAKGGNWIPAHSFVGAIPAERYAMLLAAAKHANMNMVRIWGGGIYEHDVFYDLCDELGILIWQDFMFSCAPYPEEPDEFVADVAAEVEYQVRRLRSHPSMALWCGNNENQWLHDMIHWDNPVTPVPGELYYNQIIPAAIQRLDDHIPYWPSSPYGGNDFNSQEDGDVHNWNTWHGNWFREFGEEPKRTNTPAGVSYRRYAEDMGRFSSEFGMHAAPVFETLRRNIPADQLYHHSPSMDHHNKDTPKNKGDNLMEAITGLPTTLA